MGAYMYVYVCVMLIIIIIFISITFIQFLTFVRQKTITIEKIKYQEKVTHVYSTSLFT